MASAGHFTIVVGTDYSEMAGHAVDQALDTAALHDGAEVHVIYVDTDSHDENGLSSEEAGRRMDAAVQRLRNNVSEHLARRSAKLGKTPIQRVGVHVRRGSAARWIAQLAADLDADLVVVGSSGHHAVGHFFFGSVAQRVAHIARCPVSIVRPKEHVASKNVPEIEPPCPDCVVARKASGGALLWCARHSEHHVRAHGFAYATDGVFSSDAASYASTPGQSRLG